MRTYVLKTLAVAFVVAAAVFGQAQGASAQASAGASEGERADAEVAGIVGLGFLGADLGVVLPPLFNLHDQTWAWVVFPIVGAGGGVGAGIAAADSFGKEVNISLLAVGMAAFIPTLVGSLHWKSKKEERAFEQQAMLKLGNRVALNAPSFSASPTFSAAEMFKHGVQQRNTYRFSLFSGSF